MSQWSRGFVETLLFPCPKPSYGIDSFPGELIWAPMGPVVDPDLEGSLGLCSTEETVPCLLLRYEAARYLIIYFHSNAEDLGRCRWFCALLRDQFQVHVLAVEYPGYGVCPGPVSREGVIGNALAALQFVTQVLRLTLSQVKVFGRSIGTGPALYLASRYLVAGMILVTPFLNVKEMFRERVSVFAELVEEWFPNDAEMQEVRSPTMIVHGRSDKLIPWYHGEALYNLCKARKLFINPVAMQHNSSLTAEVSWFIAPMFRFFNLPDYSFEDLEVPAWAFDKRHSKLYVRPGVEVCSHASVPKDRTVGPPIAPLGDEEVMRIEVEEELPQTDGDLHRRLSVGVTREGASLANFLTQPTVRHRYCATKQSYNFEEVGALVREEILASAASVDGGECSWPTPDMVCSLQRGSLGGRCHEAFVPRPWAPNEDLAATVGG